MTGDTRIDEAFDRLEQDVHHGIRAMTNTAIRCTVASHVLLVATTIFLIRTG